ncbi:hypothetical protein CK214_19055 [Mesorhizobium sp. WSM3882]|nr:hypothetical protein CK214_19055 [Mesorhizobium sp. WSM3882]
MPPTQDDIANALATIQRFARHFSGTEEGRAFFACARLLTKLHSNPESHASRQRGFRLRRLRATDSHYAACVGFPSFARAFVDNARHYLRHRSQFDNNQSGRPLRQPWLSISYIIDLYGGKEPDLDIVMGDLSK